jgi:hypothetical protein
MSKVKIDSNTSSYNRSGDRSGDNVMSHPKTTCGEGIASQPVRREICVAKVLPLLLHPEADLGSCLSFCSPGGFFRHCVHAAVHIVVLQEAGYV